MLNRILGREATSTTIQHVNAAELKAMIERDDQLNLLDVRTPAEYQHEGHIAGTELVPLASLAAAIERLPRDQPVVCVCRSGSRSAGACRQLARQGFEHVINLRGGMIGWQRAGFPVE